MYRLPRKRPIVRALAGDSTITSFPAGFPGARSAEIPGGLYGRLWWTFAPGARDTPVEPHVGESWMFMCRRCADLYQGRTSCCRRSHGRRSAIRHEHSLSSAHRPLHTALEARTRSVHCHSFNCTEKVRRSNHGAQNTLTPSHGSANCCCCSSMFTMSRTSSGPTADRPAQRPRIHDRHALQTNHGDQSPLAAANKAGLSYGAISSPSTTLRPRIQDVQ